MNGDGDHPRPASVAVAEGRAGMLAEVTASLARSPRELSPKYFYDPRGSELFERITELPEYYLTRAERALLERWIPEWFEEMRPASLVELGAGSASKTRVLLDAMTARGGGLYVPLDVSTEFLEESAAALREEYDGLEVAPEAADFTASLELSSSLRPPTVWALLGSTLGNFEREAAVRVLSRVARCMRPEDVFLMGADLRPGAHKTVAMLEAAYDDARGVTAAFNLNVLHVLNRELGADFDVNAFQHRAFYDAERGRIEMHLVATRDTQAELPGGVAVRLGEGESIRTEVSCKYDRPVLEGLLEPAGLRIDRWREDARGFYAILTARRC